MTPKEKKKICPDWGWCLIHNDRNWNTKVTDGISKENEI